MSFKEFLKVSEGLWGPESQFRTGLTKSRSPGAIAKHGASWPVLGQQQAATAPMPKKMKKEQVEVDVADNALGKKREVPRIGREKNA